MFEVEALSPLEVGKLGWVAISRTGLLVDGGFGEAGKLPDLLDGEDGVCLFGEEAAELGELRRDLIE